jgi:hypothetical protein
MYFNRIHEKIMTVLLYLPNENLKSLNNLIFMCYRNASAYCKNCNFKMPPAPIRSSPYINTSLSSGSNENRKTQATYQRNNNVIIKLLAK